MDTKADLAQISNPNLLDNWYFVDPINQRGQTEYTGRGYTIDRWKNEAINTSTILSITPNGLTFSGQLDESDHFFSQWIDRKPDIFYGKTLTGSVLMDGQLYTGTVIVKPQYNVWEGSNFYASGKIRFSFQMTNDNLFRFLIIYSQDMITNHSSIAACKLELGSVQTLAHQDTDGNWVLNDPPPNKALELAKCQRYYYRGKGWHYLLKNGVRTARR